MKKTCLLVPLTLSVCACSLLNSADLGPKMIITCQNVAGSLSLDAQDATDFVKNVKNLKADNPICLKSEANTRFCVNLLAASTKKCSAKAAL